MGRYPVAVIKKAVSEPKPTRVQRGWELARQSFANFGPPKQPVPAEAEDLHGLSLRGRGIHYSYAFDLGPGLDIRKLADRLLRADIAIVAGRPSNESLRVGRKILDTERNAREAERLRKFIDELYGSSPKWSRLARAHPAQFARVIYIFTKGRLRFPINRSPSEAIPDPVPSMMDTSQKMKLAEEALRGKIYDDHIFGSVRLLVEQRAHFPRYFKTKPYIRLSLTHTHFQDGQDELLDDFIEPSLMLHASGICMLTLSRPMSEVVSAKEIGEYFHAPNRKLNFVKLPVSVLSRQLAHHKVKNIDKVLNKADLEDSEGDQWLTVGGEGSKYPAPEDLNIHTVFHAYLDAIEDVAKRTRHSEWTCFMTASLGRPTCGCKGNEAKGVHRREFASLMLRVIQDVTPEESTSDALLKNHLKISDQELWLAPDNAISIDWHASETDYVTDARTLVPIESALVQTKQLEQVDAITSDAVIRDRKLFEAQKMLAVGLQEYKRNLLVNTDDPTIVNALLTLNDTHSLYSRLLERVKLLESLVATRFSRMQNRRAVAVSIIGFLIVLISVLPRIRDTLYGLDEEGGWGTSIARVIDGIFGDRGSAAFGVSALIVIGSISIIAYLSIPKWTLRVPRKQSFGMKPIGEYPVTLSDGPIRGSDRIIIDDDSPPDPVHSANGS